MLINLNVKMKYGSESDVSEIENDVSESDFVESASDVSENESEVSESDIYPKFEGICNFLINLKHQQ